MKKKTIGIVFTKVSKEKVEGALIKTRLILKLDDLGNLKIEQELIEFPFEINLDTGIYETAMFCDISISEKIGRKLKQIGFENVKLLFSGEIHEV